MAGEMIKTEAICLDIRAWSQTSHVVSWLTPSGKVTTVVKGAVRPKSFFLGQYDLNYTCEILYYARARGEVHALREAAPLARRDALRGDYRALALAGYFRRLAAELAPGGPDAADWYDLLGGALDALAGGAAKPLAELLAYETAALELLGLKPALGEEGGVLTLRGERRIPVSSAVASALAAPRAERNADFLIDAARVIGVYYAFHVDCASDVRRSVLTLISRTQAR